MPNGIGWPNGIALDIKEQKIYWCDAKLKKIKVVNVDGTNRTTILDLDYLYRPRPFGLTILGDFIYWTDWEHSTVNRVGKHTGKDPRIIADHLEDLNSLQAVSYTDLGESNACSQDNGGCSHLCLMTPEGKRCMCQSGYILKENNCFISGNITTTLK